MKYGRVKPKPQPSVIQTTERNNTATTSKAEDAKEKKTSLHKRMREVQTQDGFVGCMPSGFAFNEPAGYKKVPKL